MDLNKVVKVCAFNLLNLAKNTLIHFGTDKIFLLLGRFSKPSAQKLSWEDTSRKMATSDEEWSDWNVVIYNG